MTRHISNIYIPQTIILCNLSGKARGMYPQFRDRLARVEQMADGIGWGFHDFVGDVVGQLEEELGVR